MKPAHAVAALVTTLALASPASGSPDDDLFGDIVPVFSASKLYQDPLDAPAAVSVIDAAQIRERGYRSLSEALADVRGLWVETDRGYDQLGPRELSLRNDFSSRYLLLIDGHRTNDGLYDGALFGEGMDLVDIGLVERIEVMRGGSSILYGSAALMGVIAVTTRAPGSGPSFESVASLGSQRSAQARVTLSNSTAGVDWIASLSALKSDGEKLITFRDYPGFTPEGESPIWYARDMDDMEAVQGSLRARAGELGFNLYLQRRVDGIPTFGVGRVFYPEDGVSYPDDPFPNGTYNSQTDFRVMSSLTWDRVVAGGELSSRLTMNHYGFQGRWLGPSAAYCVEDDADECAWETRLERSSTKTRNLAWTGELDWSRRLGAHTINLGGEYRHQPRISEHFWIEDDPEGRRNSYTRSNWRVFVQDSFEATDWLRLNLGVAYNDYQYSEPSVTPRMAAILRPSANQSVKLLWGSAIRAPNGSELSAYPNYLQGLIDQVKNESVVSTGIVWEARAAGGLSASLGAYRDRFKNLLTGEWRELEPEDWHMGPNNWGRAKMDVIEAEVARRVPGRYELGAWLTHQRIATDTVREDDPYYFAQTWEIPRWIARVGAGTALPWAGGWGNVTARYVAEQAALTSDVRNPGGVRVDLSVAGKVTGVAGLAWQLSAKNLFNQSMSAPQGGDYYVADIPQPGRRVFLELRYAL